MSEIERFHLAYREVIKKEVGKLLVASFIREIQYPEWLSDIVVVPKKNGKWHVCVDYSNINGACLKDTFPLPCIDQIVDATTGHQLLSFLDAYSGYNEIPMYPLYSVNNTFITPTEMHCYNVMPFGLKNVRATYQHMMSLIFEPLLGKTMEAYIDDMLVKLKSREDHLAHLREAFQLMKRHRLRLNLDKCEFGVKYGNFLGFLVSQRGIKMAPNQVKAIRKMQPLQQRNRYKLSQES